MTESGLERSGKRLRVALHSTKWILEGGAGGRTGPRTHRPVGWREMTESGLELAESLLRVALNFAKRSYEGGCGGEDWPILFFWVGGVPRFFFLLGCLERLRAAKSAPRAAKSGPRAARSTNHCFSLVLQLTESGLELAESGWELLAFHEVDSGGGCRGEVWQNKRRRASRHVEMTESGSELAESG